MKKFVRHNKLPNICGRANYITNEKKQEEIVCQSAFIDFTDYANFEVNHKKSDKENNQGRENIIAIPNSWYELPKEKLEKRCQKLAELSCGKSTDMMWACHWNKSRTNLHIHVIFSEREKLPEEEVKRYDRDIYLTNEGKIAKKKSDRATDPITGEMLPPVHRKEEIKEGGFSAKNEEYKSNSWLEDIKSQLQAEMERMGAVFDAPGILHEYHEGKGTESATIKKKNELIRAINKKLEQLRPMLQASLFEKIVIKIKKSIANLEGIKSYVEYCIDKANKITHQEPQKKQFEHSLSSIKGLGTQSLKTTSERTKKRSYDRER